MSKSRLSHRIQLIQLIVGLDEAGCLDVIRLIQEELEYKSLNEMLINIIMQCTKNLSNDCFIKIENGIKQKYQQYPIKQKTSSINKTQNKNILFDLHRLPNDLITKTSLYLNEKDIFNFEQCCRFFYKMINNISYLKQCNNFKHFSLTKTSFNQLIDPNCSFFKFSKANTLSIGVIHDESVIQLQIAKFEKMIKEIEMISDKFGDIWFKNLLQSISTLNLSCHYSFLFLHFLPIDILFNSNESNLENIELYCYAQTHASSDWEKCMNEFGNEYAGLRQKLQQKQEKIKILECIKYILYYDNNNPPYKTLTAPRFISTRHIWLKNQTIDLTRDKFFTNDCNPHLETVTFEKNIRFLTNQLQDGGESININKKNINNNRGLAIKTLRLIGFNDKSLTSICDNKTVIQLCNLDDTLKNLTLEISAKKYHHGRNNHVFSFQRQIVQIHETNWQKAINNILTKEFYNKLENVNILFRVESNISIDWMVNILKTNEKILKHQFKRLNVGICKHTMENSNTKETYHVLEWNPKIDDKALEYFRRSCHNDEYQNGAKEKYSSILELYVD